MSDIDVDEYLKDRESSAREACKAGREIPSLRLYDKIARLRRQNEKLREGLEFYAEDGTKAQQILEEANRDS